ncbi:eukaryotic translation initiation factor 4 gamma 1 isoform X4 [Lissotriton helveticus]
MNKAPQPIGGPPTIPHPAPSPGLSQSLYPSAQTASVVFGPPQVTQMNTPSQTRPHFYQSRAQPPTSASRVQSTTSARAVPPAHVYQAGSQVMMIPSQLSYPASQGYYIQGQGRSYVVPPQQYPVQPGAPSFFPAASPTEYGTYAGAYYPAQGVQQFTPGVQAAQVMINAPPHIPTKRERKTIRIRDPNQGGKDITEEIMSGGRTTSTPTPPQSIAGEVQANGESTHVTVVVRPDDRPKPAPFVSKPSPSPPLPPAADPEFEVVPTGLILPGPDYIPHVLELTPLTQAQSSTPETDILEESPLSELVEPLAEEGRESPLLEPTIQPVPLGTQVENPQRFSIEEALEEPLPSALEVPSPQQAIVEANGILEKLPVPPSCPSPPFISVPPAQPEVLSQFELPAQLEPTAKPSKSEPTSHTPPKPEPSVQPASQPPVKPEPSTEPPVKFESFTPPASEPLVKLEAPIRAASVPPVKPEPSPQPASQPPLKPEPLSQLISQHPSEPEPPTPVSQLSEELDAPSPLTSQTPAEPSPQPASCLSAPPKVSAHPEPAAQPEQRSQPDTPQEPLNQPKPASESPSQAEAHSQLEPVMDSPIAQPEELKLANGLGLSGTLDCKLADEPAESDISPISEPEVVKAVEQIAAPAAVPAVSEEEPVKKAEKEMTKEMQPSVAPAVASSVESAETAVQAAVSVPKKKRKIKDLNKKEAVGDLLDAFKESQVSSTTPERKSSTPSAPPPTTEPEETPRPRPEDTDETWEEKEDSLQPGDTKYQYMSEQWKPLNPEEKKSYDREFLLGFQYIVASLQKPEGLPQISDVVLDKVQSTKAAPPRPLDAARIAGMNTGPDFTPSFANLPRQPMSNRGPPPSMGARRSQQGQRKDLRKIIAAVSLGEDVKLNKAEKAWKPAVKSKKTTEEEDPESIKTQDLFRRVRSILNKLTPQMFQQLMKQVTDLPIDTEERLKGVIDLIFEKAISEPNFSVAYANMCRCLMGLKVPTTDKPAVTVNFRKLLLNRCQKEFEKDKDDAEVFEKKQKEMDAAVLPEEKTRLHDELELARDMARRRSLGNIKFIGELFKLKMLTEAIMHDCVVKLLKNHDEESLECLCRLLSTIGKDLDFEKAKPRMDQYFNQMDKIIKEKKTSSRIRFMLQDLLDLRLCNWVPRRGEQGPKTIDQIHKEAQLEEQREAIKVHNLMSSSKPDKRREPPGRQGSGGGGGGGSGGGSRGGQVADDGWNTVPISKGSRPIDTSRIQKITKPGAIDYNSQLLAPGGRLMSWGKGSSGGSGAKPSEPAPEPGRPGTSTLNRFSALQQPPSDRDPGRVIQRNSSSRERLDKDRDRGDRFERLERGGERGDRFDRSEKGDRFERPEQMERLDRMDRNRPTVTKRSYSKETEDRSREREARIPQEAVRKVASMTEQRDRSKEVVKREPAPSPVPSKPSMSEDELEKKSKAIIEEYLHLNDMKEALQCVQELNSPTLLFIFVRNGIESTLERSNIARERIGLLLYQLVKAGNMSKEQYYKGLLEILEIGEDMEIDIPHIWQYLAEIITPILLEGGIPMSEVFREVTKPLVSIGKASILLVEILGLLCKGMSHKKAGELWREAGLSWKEFLPEEEDVNKFITEKKVEYTLGDETETPSRKELSSDDLYNQMEKLLKENPNNQRIFDWIEGNLSEQQLSSNTFVRALMTSVCHSAIVFENPYRVDIAVIRSRAKLLQKYFSDEQKELQALYALQALVSKLDQPPNLLRMFFDALYDEDVIKEEAFYKWESSKDPAEQQGKGVALKSVTAFFTWLREAEDESDNN